MQLIVSRHRQSSLVLVGGLFDGLAERVDWPLLTERWPIAINTARP
jgi:hypothetical protein